MYKSLRILVLSHYYPPEMGGASARVHGLARWLVAYGHTVSVITGFPNYPTGILPGEYRLRCRLKELRDDVEVIRTWVYPSSLRTSFGRLSNYFSFMISSVWTAFQLKRKFDIVVASSPPLVIGIPARFLSRLYRIPLVLDVRDIWPDVAVDAGAFDQKNTLMRLGRKLAFYLYSKSDHITPVTQLKRKKIIAAGVGKDKVTVILNGVDFDRLSPSTAVDWKSKLDLHERFVVVYTGLIGIAQGVGIVIDAAKELRDEPRIHFLIVGDGVEKDRLVKKSRIFELKNVTFVSSQPRDSIPSLLESADLAIVPLVSDRLADAVPSKLMEAWGCRKPVLVVAGGEAAELVESVDGGVVVPPGDPARLASVIKDLSRDHSYLETLASKGYTYSKAHHDRRHLAKQMENVLMTVCLKNSR